MSGETCPVEIESQSAVQFEQAYPPLEGRDPPPPLHVCKQRFVCVTPCTGTVWDASRISSLQVARRKRVKNTAL